MNKHLLEQENLTVDDVLLVPRMGKLRSRKEAEMAPFIYSAPMDTVTGYHLAIALNRAGHIPVVCRAMTKDWSLAAEWVWDTDAHIFLAVGPGDSSLNSLRYFLDYQPDCHLSVAIDIAHGHSEIGKELTLKLREIPQVVEIMSGSICTPQAAADCLRWGCTHLRVGVGPGSLCTTRRMTGVGYPQLSAIYNIYKATMFERNNRGPVTIIADGGIREPGDAVKYLAAGADAIMLGRAFSRCEESAGWVEHNTGYVQPPSMEPVILKHKRYRGQASYSFQMDNGKSGQFVEGETGSKITPQGTVQDIVDKYEAGVRSAISYLGLTSIHDLKPENVEFIRQTTSGYIEGSPHGLDSSRG